MGRASKPESGDWRDERGHDYIVHGRGWDSLIQGALETLRMIFDSGRRGITIQDLCEARDVARSTIYRDISVAKRAGWAIVVRHDKRDGNRAYYRVARS